MRRPINDGKAAFDAGLTSEGERLAQEFGYYINLYTKPSKFVCSPVGRCIDTALRISMGANSGKNILPDYRLSHTYISEPLLQLIETSNRIRTNDRAITIAMEKGALESRLPKMGFELIG